MVNNYQPADIQKRTFAFGVRVIKLVDKLPKTLSGVELARQLIRSGTSVGANVREADGAESHKDFVHKIGIAYKEAKETHYRLDLINTAILSDHSEIPVLIDEADQLARILYTIGH